MDEWLLLNEQNCDGEAEPEESLRDFLPWIEEQDAAQVTWAMEKRSRSKFGSFLGW